MNYPGRFKADIVSAVESIDLENVIALALAFPVLTSMIKPRTSPRMKPL